jgi:exosome complex component RRP4
MGLHLQKRLKSKMAEIKKKDKEKQIVIPGEVISEDKDALPGDWTIRNDGKITATRLGIADKSEKLIKVIPISGYYMPRRGNVIIAKVLDLTMRGWLMDIGAPYDAFLSLNECPMFIRENEMQDVHDVGDLVISKITKTGRNSIDLTIKGRGLGKIRDGIIMRVNPNRVPRIIGKEGSMINIIKKASNSDITVGQNGFIWIRAKETSEELFAREAINFVIENTITEGLTDKVEDWIKKNKK